MIFDLDLSQGEWFRFFESRINEKGELVYDDPKPDAGRVCIRSIAPFLEQIQAKRKKKFEWVLNTATRSMERIGYFEEQSIEDQRKERDDLWDYAITDMEDFYDVKGALILCTRENRLKLMAHPVFDRFVARCLQIISASGVKTKEEAEKN
mgnify:FL=1